MGEHVVTHLSKRVARVRAPNPSPMTLTGTNTYVVRGAKDEAVVIDPGPDIPEHVDAILEAAQGLGAHPAAILVTHDLREAVELADRVAVLHEGRLEQYAPPNTLLSSPATDYVKTLFERAHVR